MTELTQHVQHSSNQPQLGIKNLHHPVVFGGLIGLGGGLAFLLGSASLMTNLQTPARIFGALLVLTALALVLFLPRKLPRSTAPTKKSMLIYWISIGIMFALFPLAHLLTQALNVPNAQISLIAAIVGAHFLPFARAFSAPVFTWIGSSMLILGLLGAILALLVQADLGPWGAFTAGAAMVIIIGIQTIQQKKA